MQSVAAKLRRHAAPGGARIGLDTAASIRREAREISLEAKCLLQEMVQEQGDNPHRLACKKLAENLAEASGHLDAALRAYDSAAARGTAALATKQEQGDSGIGSTTAHRGEVVHPQIQALTADVSESEATHFADLVNDYAQDVGALAEDVSKLQQALLDVAEIARSQGPQLDDVEANMSNSASHSAEAVQQLHITKERRSRRTRAVVRALLIATGIISTVAAVTCWARR